MDRNRIYTKRVKSLMGIGTKADKNSLVPIISAFHVLNQSLDNMLAVSKSNNSGDVLMEYGLREELLDVMEQVSRLAVSATNFQRQMENAYDTTQI